MNTFDAPYQMLNAKQKQAVDTIDGPVFVMAGPGTGKTQILTLRIANILRQGNGVEPENILALTFTNAAAYNMRERLSKIIGAEYAHRIYIATFHSFAEDMIKRFGDYFERFRGARLVSTVEQIELLTDLTNRFGGEHFSVFKRRSGTVSSISFALGKIKNEALSPEDFRKLVHDHYDEGMASDSIYYKRASGKNKKGDVKETEVRAITKKRDKNLALADIYEAYEREMRERELYDYNDLIISVVTELRNDSLFQTELQEQFQYILVDEHQDTNDGQNAILHSLIDNPVWEGKPNIFVVGDAKQSIFRFAGASEKSFTELFSQLKGVVSIELENNYRSHQGVLNHATQLITKSEYHKNEPALLAHKEEEGEIAYREFHSYKSEALWVANDIKERIANGEDPNEIAVLFRNNKDINDIRTLLGIYGIAYQDYSKKNLLEDPDMVKLFLILRTVNNLEDDEVVAKTLFVDFYNFEVIGIQKLLTAFRNRRAKDVSLFEMIAKGEKLSELGFSEAEKAKYAWFVEMITKQKRDSENLDFLNFFSQCIRETGFLKAMLGRPDSAYALAKIETLFDEVKKERMTRVEFSFRDFMGYLTTLKEHDITMDIATPLSGGVQLMTFHGSKGLEFDTVYIVRALHKKAIAGEISLPFNIFSDGEREDERRLMYVAITRAKKNCLISSFVRNEQGKEKSRAIHIADIDDLSHVDMSQWEEEHTQSFFDFFEASKLAPLSLIDQDYLQEKFLTSKLSVSALNNYMESPLLYFFRNLMLLPQSRTPSLEFGNLIHGALERFFDKAKDENEIPDTEGLREAFEATIEANPFYEEYRERGWKVLESYVNERRDAFTIPLENEVRVPALSFETNEGHTIILTGVVDKITRNDDGFITVWDYKTGKSYGELDKHRRDKIKRQATFYKLLLQHSFGGKYNFSEAVFDFIQPNEKTGQYEQQSFTISQADVDDLKEEINQLVSDVLGGTLLKKDFSQDDLDKELLDFLDVLKGPRTYEQQGLF